MDDHHRHDGDHLPFEEQADRHRLGARLQLSWSGAHLTSQRHSSVGLGLFSGPSIRRRRNSNPECARSYLGNPVRLNVATGHSQVGIHSPFHRRGQPSPGSSVPHRPLVQTPIRRFAGLWDSIRAQLRGVAGKLADDRRRPPGAQWRDRGALGCNMPGTDTSGTALVFAYHLLAPSTGR